MSWIRRTTTRVLFTLYININSKLRRQHTRGPLAAAISLLKDGCRMVRKVWSNSLLRRNHLGLKKLRRIEQHTPCRFRFWWNITLHGKATMISTNSNPTFRDFSVQTLIPLDHCWSSFRLFFSFSFAFTLKKLAWIVAIKTPWFALQNAGNDTPSHVLTYNGWGGIVWPNMTTIVQDAVSKT